MGGLGGDVFCRWPYGAPAPQGRSCADCMVFAGDYFWQRVGHLSTLSDHVDWLPLSRFYACLFPAHRYTTFEMASRIRQRMPTTPFVLATEHIRSKKSAHVGSTGSFALLSTHQISGVKVSCMTVYFLIMERICSVASTGTSVRKNKWFSENGCTP